MLTSEDQRKLTKPPFRITHCVSLQFAN